MHELDVIWKFWIVKQFFNANLFNAVTDVLEVIFRTLDFI